MRIFTRRRRRLMILVGLVALVGLGYAGRGWWLPRWAEALDVSEPPRPADYALVLGGGSDSRPFLAAALWKKGYVRGVLLPRVRLSAGAEAGAVPPEAELTRRVLRLRGVPDDAVSTLPGEVDSTFDEALALREFLDSQPRATVAVITTTYHTRRARSVFRHVLGRERAARLHFVGAPPDDFDATDWWLREVGFTSYLNESAKAAYYAVRY